ncbi:MAG: ATP synthase subunit C [Alphaproteobacteria bacterium]
MNAKTRFLWAAGAVLLALPVLAVATLFAWPAFAQEPEAAAAALDPELAKWAFIGAAIATGLSALAGGYAVGRLGSAGVGAMAERPELFGRILVLIGLAEGIAIYGLIISILILNRIG